MLRPRQLALPAVALCATVLVAGCTTGGTASGGSSASGPSTDTIRIAYTSDPSNFAPAKNNASTDYEFSRLLFDTLVKRDDDNKIIGGIAKSWKMTPDAKTATFTLRDDATCGDGSKVTATTVKDSLDWYANKQTASKFSTLVFGPGIPNITADDATGTVTVNLAQPWSDLLAGLTLAQSGIVCEPGLKDPAGLLAGSVKGAFTGPYVLDSMQRGVSYTMSLRDGYDGWGAFAKKPAGTPAKKIVASIIPNVTTVANQLATGQLDIAPLAGQDVRRFDKKAGFTEVTTPWASLYIYFNQRPGHPGADENFRKAVAAAVNQKGFNAAATDNRGELMLSNANQSVACVNTDKSVLPKYDPAAAKKVLSGTSFRMVGSTSIGPNGAAGIYVQQALREAGANPTLDNIANPDWAATVTTKPDAWDVTVYGDINAINTMTGPMTRIGGAFSENGGRNSAGATNKDVDTAIAAAMATTDKKAQCAAWGKAQQSLLDHMNYVPMAVQPSIYVLRDGFTAKTYSGLWDASSMRIG